MEEVSNVEVPADDEFVDVYYCADGRFGSWRSGSQRVKFGGIGLLLMLMMKESGNAVLVTGISRLK